MLMFNSNEPIKLLTFKISQSINVEWRAGDKNGQEKLWSFDKARNVLVEKTKARAVKNILPLDFARYLGYSEV